LAKSERTRLETSDRDDDFRKAGFAVLADESLPVRPAAVFKHPLYQPRSMVFGVDRGAIDIPEKVLGQGSHGVSLVA
jgi:hypothetical protein